MNQNTITRGRWSPLLCMAIMASNVGCCELPSAGLTAPLPPPRRAVSLVRDACGNWWALAKLESGKTRLIVLPAQDQAKWIEPAIKGVPDGDWRRVLVTGDGFVWLQGEKTIRFDPRKPDKGAAEALAPREDATPWEPVARMPASNHDISAAVLDDKVYIAGGLTADFGFPARSRSFDEAWELDASRWSWRVLAKLGRDRIYCATAAFDGAIWVVGGDIVEPDGKRTPTTLVQRIDPRSGAVTPGVPLTAARPMPIALEAGGRLYVVGNPAGEFQNPGKIESIGRGEVAWRQEPDGPEGMSAIVGVAMGAKLYVVVPRKGLAVYDTEARRWELIVLPSVPRSCQMAGYRGEIWMMGGVDIQDPRQTLIYNPATGKIRSGPPLPVTISWGAAAVVNHQLIITGGAGLRGATDHTYVYNDRTFVLRH